MESITKWELGSVRTYYSIKSRENFQEDEFLDISLVPRLQEELWKAQSRIKELEAEKFGSGDNVRCFIRNQRNEREETNDALVDCLKEKLRKEREETKRAKAENSRLKKKILGMESSVNRLRRERDTMEKVCEELVTRIDELKANTKKMWDETEEERKMLQMAEMWREERVRVKFTEATLALQEKYEEMNLYVVELEKCLQMVREVGGSEEMGLRRGEGLVKIARSMEPIDSNNDFKFVSD
ncbi:hypothetical protein CARUB_v10010144mg [Capsella rubella]|uniref:Uncharacterized protein n=1 Tax=Capsella rubella TaxID=81985 RepID=R0IH96_9BRAS|nr:protein BRANCHLESS TRICHOME [Capsella rubella]EOA36218.1 hypothetical protein CARUB_v10010144mg [Capsella rubella]